MGQERQAYLCGSQCLQGEEMTEDLRPTLFFIAEPPTLRHNYTGWQRSKRDQWREALQAAVHKNIRLGKPLPLAVVQVAQNQKLFETEA